MGGHAFGGNAERLSTAQLEALRNYCRDRLSSILSNIGVLRSVTSKLTHSDLDLVGGLPLCHGDFFRGSDSGRLSRSGESLGICHSVQLSKKLRGEKRSREEARIEEANSLVNKAAEAIGAIEWARCGNTSFYKVPCDRLYPEMASDKHYQVDVVLVVPAAVEFAAFLTSYSSVLMILSEALNRLSRSFVLHGGRFIIRHNVFRELQTLDIDLSESPSQFCAFLGLDYSRWEAGFESEEEVWEWLVDVEETHILALAWIDIANHRLGVARPNHRAKAEAMPRFNGFLQKSRWFRHCGTAIDSRGIKLPDDSYELSSHRSASELRSQIDSANIEAAEGLRVNEDAESDVLHADHCVKPRADFDTDTHQSDLYVGSKTLNRFAIEALQYFGKYSEWQRLVTQLHAQLDRRIVAANAKNDRRMAWKLWETSAVGNGLLSGAQKRQAWRDLVSKQSSISSSTSERSLKETERGIVGYDDKSSSSG